MRTHQTEAGLKMEYETTAEHTLALELQLSSSRNQCIRQLAKIDELVAQNQALQRENDNLRVKQHWTEELQKATAGQCEQLKGEIRNLETALTQARELLVGWNQTNEAQLAELTRLYAIEAEAVPALQGQVNALELEVKSLRDWNAATAAPVRCECKTCDRLAWEATQLHQ